jgi:hypothetical protein
MNDRPNRNIGRRDLLCVTALAIGATVSAPCVAAAATRDADSDRDPTPRYQAASPEIQTFYRVNRYPGT